MKLWVGLGNPGARYERNRHNIGFMAVDRIAADHGFSGWRRAFRGEVAEGRFGTGRVLLLKPATFMNLSGEAVRAALDFHKLAPADVTVFHDDLDLAPGKCRVKPGGGHAGHNGLRSIHAHLGTDAYGRVRLGIGHPGHKDAVQGYVLHDFARADADWLDDLLRGISEGAPHLAAGDAARFQTAVALRTAPPRNAGPAGAPA
jgi:PTH1 family peptidyl-tRNA hydrolase